MFKTARWRSEKNKDKAVFRFNFHATQLTKLGWEVAMVSVVPVGVGKPTARSEKAVVLEGVCHWKKPIYQTIKLVKDPKNGNNNDKLYNFIVSAAGSPNPAVIGEATINLSDYAEALKPSTVTLLLKASDSGPILHVTLQRLEVDVGKRKSDSVEEQKKISDKLSNCDEEESNKIRTTNVQSTKDVSCTKSPRRFPYNLTTTLLEESNDTNRNSDSSGTVSAVSNSDNSGQCFPKENGTESDDTQKDYACFQSPFTFSKNGPARSMDGLTNSSDDVTIEENLQDLDVSMPSDRSTAKSRQLWELELQTLRKRVVKETRRGQELSRELSIIKEERDALRKECDELSKKKCCEGTVSKKSSFTMLEEVEQELNYEKSLNSNLRLQLQKTQESNSELILAVRDLDELLDQKNRELSIKLDSSEDSSEVKFGNGFLHSQSYVCEQELIETMYDEDNEQYALEALARGRDDVKVAYSLEQQIVDLKNELEMCTSYREELEMQLEQSALDYEILKQENHNISKKLEQSQMREQLRMQYDCSSHLAIISDLEDNVKILKSELEEQAKAFEADLQTITQAKVQQEQRAIQAEEALRKSRRSNAKAAEQLEEDFERLSAQISSTFHMNEKLAMEAAAEGSELRLQNRYLEELLEKTKEELSSVHEQCNVKVQELSRMVDLKTKEIETLHKELKGTSENQKREEAERSKALITEIEQLKEYGKEIENKLQRRNAEVDMLGRELDLAKLEADESHKEKEIVIENLKLELTTLRTQYNDLKHSLVEDEMEKENLRKEVFRLRDDLRRKKDTIASTEKKHKDTNTTRSSSNGITKTSVRNKNNINGQALQESKEVSTLREKIKLLEGKIKMKDKTLGDVTNSFQIKEKDLCKRIEELEKNIGQYIYLHQGIAHKETVTVGERSDIVNANEPPDGDKEATHNLNGIDTQMAISTLLVTASENVKTDIVPDGENHGLSEVRALKEKNEAMEAELKEIQERYSEISLKFAEVEGERQKLVMTVRSLKSSLMN